MARGKLDRVDRCLCILQPPHQAPRTGPMGGGEGHSLDAGADSLRLDPTTPSGTPRFVIARDREVYCLPGPYQCSQWLPLSDASRHSSGGTGTLPTCCATGHNVPKVLRVVITRSNGTSSDVRPCRTTSTTSSTAINGRSGALGLRLQRCGGPRGLYSTRYRSADGRFCKTPA